MIIAHARLDGWRLMADKRWHLFCDRLSMCARWLVPYRQVSPRRYHEFPVCTECLKLKYGM